MSDLPEIDMTDGNPSAIRQLRALLDSGALPGTYVGAGGELVLVEEISGTPGTLTGHDDAPVPVVAAPLPLTCSDCADSTQSAAGCAPAAVPAFGLPRTGAANRFFSSAMPIS